MRWDGLFEDLEARWAGLAREQIVADAAELTRAEWSRTDLPSRLRGAVGTTLRLHLSGGQALDVHVQATGADWVGGVLAAADSVIVPLASLAAVEGELGAVREAPGGVVPEQSMAAVLRRVARLRSPVRVTGVQGAALVEGTVDRVGTDHMDVARHAWDEARRRTAVRGGMTVPFTGIGWVQALGTVL
ncbi:hypothetical protein [Micrococcus sp.]|uniref:hypothetical protein n=1 Tax=Micrococcus sp. TaxID=1271 RepID=UPI002A91B6CA|nr:hypothetical protein [Micrococcus sp.]MDY6055899.1 hypothetical protein [Micrococcus sp.]